MRLGEMAEFRLVPFPDAASSAPRVAIRGVVTRGGGHLRVLWIVEGEGLVVPEPAAQPERRDGLWRSTCVELFVAPRERPEYVELNLSPSGDWNVYRFSGYRAGMEPLPIHALPSTRGRAPDGSLALGATLPLPPDFANEPLAVGVCAVLEHEGGAKSYHALAHTADRPDFHQRESFQLLL
jgi:hypothetical protein